ncbi:phenylacetate--CoA ligase family protein [Litorilituus lipolyticus]|uniref:Phenylacetate--CoA ligase family protein n=1 Tax=Litorilituus lipolyticus TaxID=2491017 RepID=A0A502KNM8_9GAMM|nr:AMP-binding protein [Litorilituus lipolyticus]TPH13290.1 phenylacetate--CoA ligase family protein [Litorilituus lipolyticus]
MAGLYTKIVSTLFFPLHEWLKGHKTVSVHKNLEQSQWLSKDKILVKQQQRLQRFIAQISVQVPYYQQLFQDHNLSAEQIENVQDLAKLPFLDKHTIKDNFAQMRATNSGAVTPFTTGGSSGNPLTFLLSNERVSHDVAEKWRATRWWDVDIGDKEIVAWGSPIELGAQDKVRVLRDKLFRSTLIPAFDMDESKILGFIKQIQQTNPTMLFGYPSVFHLIAKTAHQHQIALSQLNIKVIFVTSERLYPYQKEMIEQVFNAPVANGYGSRDAGFIAHQCPEGNMHISAEDIIVEIIDKQGKVMPEGEKGEIVVTHLATGDFPFVRYKTGDIAAIDSQTCPCGRGLPVLKDIEGRSTDFVVAADGTLMHGLALIYVIRELDGVEAFKIIQETKFKTRIELVPTVKGALSEQLSKSIISGFKARLGENVTIEIDVVDNIAAEKSGKFRYVISKVES